MSDAIDGDDGVSWHIPLPPLDASSLEPYSPGAHSCHCSCLDGALPCREPRMGQHMCRVAVVELTTVASGKGVTPVQILHLAAVDVSASSWPLS